MYQDPIVAEVHQFREFLVEEVGGDVHTFFQFLREVEQQYQDRLDVSMPTLRIYSEDVIMVNKSNV